MTLTPGANSRRERRWDWNPTSSTERSIGSARRGGGVLLVVGPALDLGQPRRLRVRRTYTLVWADETELERHHMVTVAARPVRRDRRVALLVHRRRRRGGRLGGRL